MTGLTHATVQPPQPWVATRAVGWAAASAVAFWAMSVGTPPWIFIDVASALGTLVLPAAVLVAAFGPSGIGAALRTLQRDADDTALAEATSVFLTAGVIVTVCSLGAMLLGLVQMLHHLDEPTRIGPAMALTLLSALYGLVGNVVCFSCANTAVQRASQPHAWAGTVALTSMVTGAFSLTMWVIPLVQFALLVWVFAPSPAGV